MDIYWHIHCHVHSYIHCHVHCHFHGFVHCHVCGFVHGHVHGHVHCPVHGFVHGHVHGHFHGFVHCHVCGFVHGHVHGHGHCHVHGFVHGHVHGRSCLFHGEFICISSTVILFLQTTCEWGLVSVMARYAPLDDLECLAKMIRFVVNIPSVCGNLLNGNSLVSHRVFSIQSSVNQTSSIYLKYHPLPQVLVG